MTSADYAKYKHLLQVPYIEGEQDCYSLVRGYYSAVFDIHLEDYARPADFAHSGLDLISRYFMDEGFAVTQVGLSQLSRGDVILFIVGKCAVPNHLGVYVGGNLIIHHLFGRASEEENFGPQWHKRTMMVLRHPDATDNNSSSQGVQELLALLPERQRVKLGLSAKPES